MSKAFVNEAYNEVARRGRQVAAIWKMDGYRGITERARRKIAEQMRPRAPLWEVLPEDVIAADIEQPFEPAPFRRRADEPIALNWVTTPAGPGSGGHATSFRILKYLQERGFRNTVYFYDIFSSDHNYYADIARRSYGLECEIRDLRDGVQDADAIIATSWATAYPVYNLRCKGKRFYFVQDYEPSFYPVGANSLLAENTYRMGFHGITAGRWLAETLSSDFGMKTDYFPFGCDVGCYFVKPSSRRSGIAFYARPRTPRRGHELGLLALELFARRFPDVDIHFFGEPVGQPRFKIINHGLVSPSQLNDIYNQCFAALSLSLTNVSLVPMEMLAAGCIPVINDAPHNRMVLENPHVRYAPASPHALASALGDIVTAPDFERMSGNAAQSVATASWDEAGAAVERTLRDTLAS